MDITFLIGRIIFGLYWIYNAYNHFRNYKNMSGYAASKGVPAPTVAILGSGFLLLIGGVALLFGTGERLGLIALVIFLVPVTLTMHAFWKETEPQGRAMQKIQFAKNSALLGAVLILLSYPW